MNFHRLIRMLCLALSLHAAHAWAQTAAVQDNRALTGIVRDFLQQQTLGMPGRAHVSVGPIDAQVAACQAIEPFLPGGVRAWGKFNVGIRCRAEAAWTLYVPAQVRVEGSYLVASRALSQGHVLGAGDFGLMQGDLTELPAGVVTDPAQAMGRSVALGLAAGQPLRGEWLRAPTAVQQGQSVKLLARGNGFAVSQEGRALNTVQAGQIVQVRLAGGQLLSGMARAGGIVEVNY